MTNALLRRDITFAPKPEERRPCPACRLPGESVIYKGGVVSRLESVTVPGATTVSIQITDVLSVQWLPCGHEFDGRTGLLKDGDDDETLLAPAPTRQHQDTNLSHEVCCADEERPSGRIAMCGVPLEDGPLDDDTPSCVVCQDLIERWARDADTYGEQVPCRVCPRRKGGERDG